MRLPDRWNPKLRIRDMRIRKKILLSNMVIILMLALSIGTAATLASRHYIEKNTRELSRHVIDQYSKNVDNHVKDFVSSTLFLLNDKLLTHIIANRAGEDGNESYNLNFNRVSGLLYQYGNNNAFINSITIMNENGQVYWWERPAAGRTNMDAEMARSIASKGKMQLEEVNQGIYWSASLRGTNEIALSRYYLDINQVNRNYGVIVFHLDRSYFMSLLSDGSIIQSDNLFILNERDELLYEGEPGPGTEAVLNLDRKPEQSDGRMTTINDKRSLLLRFRSAETGWSILCLIPMSRLMEGTRLLESLIVLICALFIFVAMAVAFWFSVGTTRDIKTLERTMRRLEDGDFTVKAIPAGRDEIGSLAIRFNMMVSRINELIVHVAEERLAKQKAEHTALLARINPHFLYNTLGTIRWFSRSRGQQEIEAMVSALTGLLKSSIRHSGGLEPLGSELDNVRDYVHLQKIGYGEAFDLRYEVDESLLGALVPGFILQPLVENAIMHGLEISKGSGLISIRAERRGTDLLVEVADNGIGMDPKYALELLSTDRERRYPGLNGIGIRHVHERIRSLCGIRYGLSFETAPGHGTKIILTLPFRREEEVG